MKLAEMKTKENYKSPIVEVLDVEIVTTILDGSQWVDKGNEDDETDARQRWGDRGSSENPDWGRWSSSNSRNRGKGFGSVW